MTDPHKHLWDVMEFDGGWIEYCKFCRETRMACNAPQECPQCKERRRVYGQTKSAIECPACGAIYPLNLDSNLERKKD